MQSDKVDKEETPKTDKDDKVVTEQESPYPWRRPSKPKEVVFVSFHYYSFYKYLKYHLILYTYCRNLKNLMTHSINQTTKSQKIR